MPAAASNSLGGPFQFKNAVFRRFGKSIHVMLSISPQIFGSLSFASILSGIFTILSFFDLSPDCALCPNSSDSICATCMIFRLLGGRRGPWAHSRNRPAFSQKRACLSAKFGQRALPEPLCGEIPATLETAAPQQRLRLTVAGEEGVGGMAVAGKAYPAAQPAQLL